MSTSIKNLENANSSEWSDEAVEILIKSASIGFTAQEISKALAEKGYFKTRSSVLGKINRLTKRKENPLIIVRAKTTETQTNVYQGNIDSAKADIGRKTAYIDVYTLGIDECRYIVDDRNHEIANDLKPVDGQEYYCRRLIHKGSYCEKHAKVCFDDRPRPKYMFKS